MLRQTELKSIFEIRDVVASLGREEPIPADTVQAAQSTFQDMCNEAAEFGLPAADVIRAMLRPVFAPLRGCDCWSCKTRRHATTEERLSASRLPIS